MNFNSQLSRRLIWSSILIALSVYTIFFAPIWFFILIVEGFVILGLLEYFNLAQRKGYFINRYLGLFFGFLIPLSLQFSGEGVIFTIAVLSLCIYNFNKDLKDQAIINTALTLFGLVYVAWFFSFLIKIRAFYEGSLWVFYLILIIKSGDAVAYFVGKKFGTHKYIVHISPNKSVEGAIAGFLGTLAASLISKLYLVHVELSHLAILGVIFGILSQLGDLSESLFKRDAGVKDSGQIPGLGGALDVMDSLLFCVPITYYYLVSFHS